MEPGEVWIIQHGKYKCRHRDGKNKGNSCSFASIVSKENLIGTHFYTTAHLPTGDLGISCFNLSDVVETGVGHENVSIGAAAGRMI